MSVEIQDLYPLSPLQQGMLFHNLYAPESGMYVERLRYTIRGNLNVAAFEQAWRQVMERHPILRSAFAWEEVDEPLQLVFRGIEMPLELQDWRHLPPSEQDERFQAYLEAILHRGFELTRAPLTRLALIRMAEDVHEFVWSYHHLLLDGWSVSLILGEIIALYESFSQSQKPQLEKNRPYRDYIAWLKQQDQAESEAYWRKALKGFATPTSVGVNGGYGSPGGPLQGYEVMQIHLSRQTAEKLDAFARQHRVTLNTVVQGAWALLLARYCGEPDVVFGAVASGRPADLAGSEAMIGMFINTLPVRVQTPPRIAVLPWLEKLQAQQVEARRYEYNPLIKVREWSEVPRGLSLFESIMVFENPSMSVRLGQQEGSPEITYSIHHATVTGYPLTVVVEPGPAGVAIGITYDRHRFDPDTVRRMQTHFQTLLEGILANPQKRISDLSLLAEAERRQLTEEWNETKVDFPLDKCLHQLFEAQVEQTPQAVAVVYEAEKLTYRELNARANRLAAYLRARGVGPESLVGICLDRSPEMMVAILGVLKAGGAYVPLDPAYPRYRLAFMLDDCQAAVILTEQRLVEGLGLSEGETERRRDRETERQRDGETERQRDGETERLRDRETEGLRDRETEGLRDGETEGPRESDNLSVSPSLRLSVSPSLRLSISPSLHLSVSPSPIVVCLEAIAEKLARESAENLASEVSSDNAAYVIYTSGSTGKPKGVIVSHRAVGNHMHWLRDHFALKASDCFLQKTAFSFDAAGTEFYAPLLVGARLIMAQAGGQQDSSYLARMITEHGVTILQLVPSLLRVLLDEPEFVRCESLRRVICAGEALPAELQARFAACPGLKGAELHNFYGPTEAAIDVTYWPHQHADGRSIVPIGRPLANTQTYLLSSELELVPVGVAGELYIGGENLARGYLKRPELTAAAFIPDAFSREPGGRLYGTGDLARYLPDGNIEYLGRIDHQVKVRGFRIELGEIETALNQHPGVGESAVIAHEDGGGNKRLVAYVVAEPGYSLSGPSNKELREFLKAKLPEYMVPSALVLLESLPLTPNGKVDRRALPAPDGARPDLGESFVAPRTPVEELLAGIWAEVLGVKQVGIRDNFFELGGDSILSIQVVGKAGRQGIRVTPRQLFQHPTICELATVVGTAASIQAEQGPVVGPAPLTPIQQWFFEQNLAEPHHWNHAILLTVGQALDATLLEKAVRQLLAHHDALRMRFVQTESGWEQTNAGWDEEDRGSRIEDRGSRIEDRGSRIEDCDPRSSVPFTRFDLSAVPAGEQSAAIEARSAGLQASLNLSQGPLVRVALFDLGPRQSSRLLILIHHLVVDGVAWRILLEDLMTAYQQLSQGGDVQMPPKTTSFKHWARKLTAYAQTAELKQELPYWLAPARAQAATLPVDYPEGRSANTAGNAQTISVSLTGEETRALLQEVPNTYRTQINDVLMTALARSFSQWTGERTLLVDMEGHGREAIFDEVDLSRTVGWFTTIFPVLLNLAKAPGPGEALKSVKEQIRAIPGRGIGYGLLRYLSGDGEVAAQLRQLPQAEASFNYLGQFDQVLPESSPFGPAPESVGPVHSPRAERRYLLEVNAFISGGRLQLEWAYNEQIHRRETIARLAEEYTSALRTLIAHCLSPEAAQAGGYTPSDFPLARLEQSKLDWLTRADREIEDLYPLSPVQEGMLFYTLLATESGAYVTQVIYELEGLNVPAMKGAWQQVLDRHPILRTTFAWKNLERPLQMVRRRVNLPLTEEDWRGLTRAEREARLDDFLKADQKLGFDLSEAPPMRMNLFRVADNTWQLVWSYHHLLLDGWSVPLLTKEFLGLYEAFDKAQDLGRQQATAGSHPQHFNIHLEHSRPYRDYIEWIERQDLSRAAGFWRRFLKGFTSPTPLSVAREPRALPGGNGYAEQDAWFAESATTALHTFARKHRLTLNTLVQAAWALLLVRESGHQDVVFGATLSGRPAGLPGAETMIGLFINTLPVRVRVPSDGLLMPWLGELQDQQAELRQYETSPLNEVQRWSEVPRDKPLFESIVVFENFPMDGTHAISGQGLRFVNSDFIIRNNFPLTVRAVPGSKLLLKVLYDTSRFDAAAIARVLAQLETLLRNIVTRPDATLPELMEQLAEADRHYQSKKEEEFKATRQQKLKDIKRKAVR